jgi:hypothetical protein
VTIFADVQETAFALEHLPVLTRGRGIAAEAYLSIPDGRDTFLTAVRDLVTDPALEEGLKQDIQQRSALLESLASAHIEPSRLRFSQTVLLRKITKRFEDVRRQLALSTNVSVPATKRLPVVKVDSGKGNGAIVKNDVDFGALYSSLVDGASTLTSSIPVKVFQLDVIAPSNALESLAWSSTNWVRVTVVADGQRFTNVNLKLKGHGTRQTFAQKPSFTLSFKQSEPQEFNGSSKIHVQNARYDPSLLNQFIGAWVFQKAALPVARIDFASVTINGKPYGTFVISEGITKGLLARDFGEAGGVLFEGETGDLDSRLDLDSGRPTPQWVHPSKVFLACQAAIERRSLEEVRSYIDLDLFGRFCAAEVFIGHIDGYSFRQRNYRIYSASPTRPLQFIPHGMDCLAFDIDEGLFPPVKGVAAQALFAVPAGRETYVEAADALVKRIDLRQLANDAACVTRMIQPVLKQYDPELARQQLKTTTINLGKIGDRHAYLSKEIMLQQTFRPVP